VTASRSPYRSFWRPSGCSRSSRADSLRRLPLASVPEVPAAAGDILYGFGRIDASGRVADRAVSSALGWRAGDRLTLRAAGVVLARRDPCGLVTAPARPDLAIPAALRRRCELEPDQVHFTGTLIGNPPSYPAQAGLRGSDAALLARQGATWR
jgi:hypothetical protein